MERVDDNRTIVKKTRLNLINLKYCLELRYRPAAAVIGEIAEQRFVICSASERETCDGLI